MMTRPQRARLTTTLTLAVACHHQQRNIRALIICATARVSPMTAAPMAQVCIGLATSVLMQRLCSHEVFIYFCFFSFRLQLFSVSARGTIGVSTRLQIVSGLLLRLQSPSAQLLRLQLRPTAAASAINAKASAATSSAALPNAYTAATRAPNGRQRCWSSAHTVNDL